MTDWVGRWLIGITCAALVLAIAESLTPAGSIRRIGKLAGALVMLFAAISPIVRVEYTAGQKDMTDLKKTKEEYEQVLTERNNQFYLAVIEQNIAAYILDKAKAIGVTCRAEVVLAEDGTGDIYPSEVYLYGTWSDDQCTELSNILYRDLGIEAEKQFFERLEE